MKALRVLKVVDRYLVREMLGPLTFGVVAFASLFMGSELITLARLVANSHTAPIVAARLFGLRLPYIISLSLPMATLLATLLALSRLGAAAEITAMRAAGLGVTRLAAPLVVVGLVVSFATLGLGETAVPRATTEYQKIMVEEVQGASLPQVAKNVILKEYDGDRLKRFLYAVSFDKNTLTMTDVAVTEFDGGRPARQTNAKRLVWRKGAWYLEDGVSYLFPGMITVSFRGALQPLDLRVAPAAVASAQKSPEDMTIRELLAQLALLARQPAPEPALREYRVQLGLKTAFPAAAFIFALVGVPLGLGGGAGGRQGASVGFGLAVVVIFLYYIVLTLGTALAEAGAVPAWLGAWLANLVLAAAGVALLVRRARH